MIKFNPQKSFSHALILVCVIIAIIGWTLPGFQWRFGLTPLALHQGVFTLISQSVLFQFLHGGIPHLLFNSYFLYVFGPEVEARMSQSKFLIFFVTSTIFIVVGILAFGNLFTQTIGISGFCMALLAYIAADLYNTRHPGFNNVVMMLVLNIAIGFAPWISLIGHAFGAIWWLIFWYVFTKKKLLK